MSGGSASVAAHSGESCPAGRPGGQALSYSRSRRSASLGSRRARNDLGGSPPHASEYIALWPAAHTHGTIGRGSVAPARPAETKPASSPQLAAAANTPGAPFRQGQIFAPPPPDE